MKIRNGSYWASSCQSRHLPPHRLGASFQEARVYQPDHLMLTHSERLTKLRRWACWEGPTSELAGLCLDFRDAFQPLTLGGL